MMSKSGKMRGLVRELRTQFKDPNAEEWLRTYLWPQEFCLHNPHFENMFLLTPRNNHFNLPYSTQSQGQPAFYPRCAKTLEQEIKKIDAQYDLCNEAWAKGEQDKFWGDELPDTRYGIHSHTFTKISSPFENTLYMWYMGCFPRSVMSLNVESVAHACLPTSFYNIS